jgi:hypothetical protein
LIRNYHLEECQLDELWSFVKKRKRTSRHWKNSKRFMVTNGSGSALTRVTRW